MLSPAEVVLARCRAFTDGDFPRIYDFYHPDSFFRRLYPEREGYLDYAREVLARDFAIERMPRSERGSRMATTRASCIIWRSLSSNADRKVSNTPDCVFTMAAGAFLTTQKLERHDFAGPPETIGWEDFDRVEEKIIY